MFDWLASPEAWVALATLTALEIVLGIDNIIFISILVGRLPPHQRNFARRTGLALAMLERSRGQTLRRWAAASSVAARGVKGLFPGLREEDVHFQVEMYTPWLGKVAVSDGKGNMYVFNPATGGYCLANFRSWWNPRRRIHDPGTPEIAN